MSDGAEDAIRKNILAIKAHSEDTRELVRELERKLATMHTMLLTIQALKDQVGKLQVKLYSGGATD